MHHDRSSNETGRDHYAALYREKLELEAAWLRMSASDKVDSIEYFLKRHRIVSGSMLELGCGTGAVIQECRKRNLSARYTAMDYSCDAIECLRGMFPDIETVVGDITSEDLTINGSYDTVVLCHVLEHLETPDIFLRSIRNNLEFDRIIIEIPLEDLPVRKLRDRFRDRRDNAAGHVRFYNISSFERLLTGNGFKILDRRRYLPIWDLATLAFISHKDGYSRLTFFAKMLTNVFLPRLLNPFWKRWYYSHYAVMCEKERRG